jgi:hypothetical protein
MASAWGTHWTRNSLGWEMDRLQKPVTTSTTVGTRTKYLSCSPLPTVFVLLFTQYQLGEKGAHFEDLRRFGRFGCLYSRLTVVEQHCCAAADHVPDPGQAPVLRYHKVHKLPAQRPSNARGGGGRRRLRHLARSGGLHCGRPQYECSCESVLTGTLVRSTLKPLLSGGQVIHDRP